MLRHCTLNRLAVIMLVSSLPIISSSTDIPAVTVLGEGGPYLSGWADSLMPFYATNNQLAYADLQFEGSGSDSGVLSVGSGYRTKLTQQGILGGYLFYDRTRSSSEEYYNVLSPGVEYLTPTWKYRLNYYAPFGNKKHTTDTGWADEFGNFSFVEFSGHREYDEQATQYETLSYGGDASVSYRFQDDQRFEIELAPYAYNRTEDSTIVGGNAQINFYADNHAQFFIGDGYDNSNHNRVYIGVAMNFGGRDNSNTMDNLMHSPVYRNLNVNTTNNGASTDDYTTYSGVEELEEDNIYFVNNTDANQATESTPDGTYENPYNSIDDFNSANTDGDVDSDANVWLASNSSSYTSTDTITLNDTQDLYGRSEDYTQAADDGDVVIDANDDSGIELNGTNTVSNVTVLGDGTAQSTGITINSSGTLDNVIVGTNTSSGSYQIGVRVTDDANATINNSTINGYAESTYNDSGLNNLSIGGVGIGAEPNSSITVTNSTISSKTTNGASYDDGIVMNANASVDISDSTISANATDGQAWGIYSTGSAGDITVTNSTISVTGNKLSNNYGIYSTDSKGNLSINNSVISVSNTSSSGGVDGVYFTGSPAEDSITANITDSTFNLSANGSEESITTLNATTTISGNTVDTD